MALPLTLDARSLGGLSGADRGEKTLLPSLSLLSEMARGLGTFLSEGRTVTWGAVPGCGNHPWDRVAISGGNARECGP